MVGPGRMTVSWAPQSVLPSRIWVSPSEEDSEDSSEDTTSLLNRLRLGVSFASIRLGWLGTFESDIHSGPFNHI